MIRTARYNDLHCAPLALTRISVGNWAGNLAAGGGFWHELIG